MLFLSRPSEEYAESFLRGVAEYQTEGYFLEYALQDPAFDVKAVIADLNNQHDRAKLLPGYVPSTEFWLIDPDGFSGSVNLRHELNERLAVWGGHIGYDVVPSKRRRGYGTKALELVLPEARKIGLQRVLITCSDDNIGSRKIIEANGGQFEKAVEVEIRGQTVTKLRYWIDL